MNGHDAGEFEEWDRQGAKSAKGGEGGDGEELGRALVEPGLAVDELARLVIGAAIEVHRALGPGYLERVYEDALAIEFRLRGIPHVRQAPASVVYKGQLVGEGRLDFLEGGRLIVELKAVEEFASVHKAQVLS